VTADRRPVLSAPAGKRGACSELQDQRKLSRCCFQPGRLAAVQKPGAHSLPARGIEFTDLGLHVPALQRYVVIYIRLPWLESQWARLHQSPVPDHVLLRGMVLVVIKPIMRRMGPISSIFAISVPIQLGRIEIGLKRTLAGLKIVLPAL
jgi:hypothetical protein